MGLIPELLLGLGIQLQLGQDNEGSDFKKSEISTRWCVAGAKFDRAELERAR